MDKRNYLENHRFIVLSSDNGNALGVIRSIGEYGLKPVLIYAYEENRLPCLIKSKYISELHIVSSYERGIDFIVSHYGDKYRKPFLFTCDDTAASLVDARYEELLPVCHFFNAGSSGRINYLMNKYVQAQMAEECGFKVPWQVVVDRGVIPEGINYPIITKTPSSLMGAWKDDVFICNNDNELTQAFEKIHSPKVILQDFIDKRDELTIEALSVNGGADVLAPYKVSYLRMEKNTFGNYLSVSRFDNAAMFSKLSELISKCRYAGCFEIEFIEDKSGVLWFLELNFRFSFWNYVVTYGGLNYPICWAEATLAGNVPSLAAVHLRDSFSAMNEPGDFAQSVSSGQVPFGIWIKQLRQTDMLFIYNHSDRMPAVSFWYHKITRFIHRKIGYALRKNHLHTSGE